MDNLNVSLGKRFQTARKMLKLTQKQVGDAINNTRENISAIEKGKREKVNNSYLQFLKERNVSEEWLLFGTGIMMDDDKKEGNISTSAQIDRKILTILERFETRLEALENKFLKIESKIESISLSTNSQSKMIDLMTMLLNMNNLEVGKFRGVPQVSGGLTKVVSLKIAS